MLRLRMGGIGDGLLYAAVVICLAGNTREDEDVHGKQAKEPLHIGKDKDSTML